MNEIAYRKYYNRPDMVWQKQREINFYRKLYCLKHFPDLVAVDESAIYITYCGLPLMDQLSEVALDNVREQLDDMLTTLEKVGIRHRDITTGNLCWKNGCLYLVDFGWSIWDKEEDSPVPVPAVMRGWMCSKSDREQAAETLEKLREAKEKL